MLSYLSAAAATLGLAVGALGLIGLLTYSVSIRTRELGLRMALGGTRERLVGMIVGEGMKLVMLGVVLGLPGAYAAAQLTSSVLCGVAASDPVSFVVSALVMLLVGVVACAGPALRIASISPGEALRQD